MSEEEIEEKYKKDPLSSVFGGMILIVIGFVFFLMYQNYISSDQIWAYLMIGLGCVFLLDVFLRLVIPKYRKPLLGRIITAAILILIGIAGLTAIEQWWPLFLILLGVIIIAYSSLSRIS